MVMVAEAGSVQRECGVASRHVTSCPDGLAHHAKNGYALRRCCEETPESY